MSIRRNPRDEKCALGKSLCLHINQYMQMNEAKKLSSDRRTEVRYAFINQRGEGGDRARENERKSKRVKANAREIED